MKKHFKLVLAALSAFLLFLTNVPVVSAAEGDASQSGDNEQLYKTTITIHVVDWAEKFNGGTQTVTVVSSSPLYICKYRTDEPAIYLRYFCGDIVDYEQHGVSVDFSNLTNCSASYLFTYADGTTEISNRCVGASAIEYRGKVRMTVTATCPIFTDEESLENHLRTGATDGWENYMPDKEWNYSGTIKATDSIVPSVADNSYSLCSDGRLAILNEEEYVYQLYTGTGSAIYEESGGSLTKLSVDGVLWYNLFPMTKYNSYESTIPIFKSREKLLNYIETGNLDGCVNAGKIPQDNSLPYLQRVKWTSVADCYGGIPYIMGDQMSWLVEDEKWSETGKVEVQEDVKVKVSVVPSSLPAGATSAQLLDQYINVPLTSLELDSLGLGFVDYSAGSIIIPDDKIETLVQAKIDETFGSNRYKYLSHDSIYIYVRLSWFDDSQGKMLYSGWTRVSTTATLNNINDFAHTVTGNIVGSTGGMFSFEVDTDSDSSYEYNKDFDGNYPFDDDSTGSSKIPTSIDEALSSFVDIIGSLMKSIGKVPALIKTVFGFLPNVFFILIGCSFTVVVILRILGR